MQRIFPNARDYKTVTVAMTPEKVRTIEETIATKLDDSEKAEFNFYDIIGDEARRVGTIIALAGKGEYGVIEVVIGVDPAGKITGVYIQRSRERATKAVEAPEFLSQFVGKSKSDAFSLGADIRPVSPEAEQASQVVAFVVKKMLVFGEVLTRGETEK